MFVGSNVRYLDLLHYNRLKLHHYHVCVPPYKDLRFGFHSFSSKTNANTAKFSLILHSLQVLNTNRKFFST